MGTDTLVQERVPAHMLGRVFGTVYGGAQLASALSYIIAGPLVALTGHGPPLSSEARAPWLAPSC